MRAERNERRKNSLEPNRFIRFRACTGRFEVARLMQLPFDLSLLTLLAYPHSSFDRNLLYRYLELSGVPLKVTETTRQRNSPIPQIAHVSEKTQPGQPLKSRNETRIGRNLVSIAARRMQNRAVHRRRRSCRVRSVEPEDVAALCEARIDSRAPLNR